MGRTVLFYNSYIFYYKITHEKYNAISSKNKDANKIFKIKIIYQVQYQHYINCTTNKFKTQNVHFGLFKKPLF